MPNIGKRFVLILFLAEQYLLNKIVILLKLFQSLPVDVENQGYDLQIKKKHINQQICIGL